MSSPERELLRRISSHSGTRMDTHFIYAIRDLLAQPEQTEQTEREPNQDIISGIEYLITAFENGAYAVDYWRDICDLRDYLINLKRQVSTPTPTREPLSDEEIKQTTKNMSEFAADMFKAGIAAAERAYGIGEGNE
jgi:hypothetical protein